MRIGNVQIGSGQLGLILGPCVIESLEDTLKCAETILNTITSPFIFKASFDKANRSSIKSFRGVGFKKGLQILKKVKEEFGIPVTTDIHSPDQAIEIAEICDLVQIPALLCKQTDILISAANTKRPINIKKGPFLSPHDMLYVVEKIESTGNKNILLTERGSCFGYNRLVNDMLSIPIMQKFKHPVCFDVSHSLQVPGGSSTGGSTELFLPLARAAIGAGADAIFLETHHNPLQAKCDPKTQLPIHMLKKIVPLLNRLYKIIDHA